MANLQALFASAPRLKLYINSRPVAYAIGFNFNVSVEVQPVFVLGDFKPKSLEPTMYNTVTGTMQIVRLLSPTTKAALLASADSAKDEVTGQLGSSTSIADSTSLTDAEKAVLAAGGVTNNPISQSDLFRHVTPNQLLLSQAFDMSLYMKVPNATNTDLDEVAWMQIQSCRITSRNTNISMGQLVNEPLNFQGLLALHSGETNKFTLDGATGQKNG